MINLNLEGVQDPEAREALKQILDFIKSAPFLSGSFEHFEEVITRPSSSYKIRHYLGFKPSDVFISWVTNGVNVTVNYAETSKDYVVLNIPSQCTVRFLLGYVPKEQEL